MNNKKLVVIACSATQSVAEKGFIDKISHSDELSRLASYSKLREKRECILPFYNYDKVIFHNSEKSAIDIYKGRQYKNKSNEQLCFLMRDKYNIQNVDMLIVSTLYGIVHFDDRIYPYNVSELRTYWGKKYDKEIIRNIILEFYRLYKFDSMHIFLPKTYFKHFKLELFGNDPSIFCYIPLKNGKRAPWYPISNTLFSFLKNGYIKEDFNLKICNPSQYRNY